MAELPNVEGTPQATGTDIDPNAAGTNLTDEGATLGDTTPLDPSLGSTGELETSAPEKPIEGTGQVGATTEVEDIGEADAVTGELSDDALVPEIQGELSEGALAVAATQELDPKATTSYQLGELMASIEQGKPLPPWASPSVRKVSAMMSARGMGSGTMASAAMIQAIMEAGTPIAKSDADAYGRIQLQNLTNEQSTALQNAVTIASMDTANLNARMTAAVTNAQSFLTMSVKNLDNEQQSRALTYNAKLQKSLQDAGAENTRKQMNAKNELQMEEFYAELGSQIESANANRIAAMEQFNVDQSNSMLTYNQSMLDSREKFNATAKFAIDQSNVTWRRDVNTANTATQNETNRINVQNEFNATMATMNNVWQKYRDNATFNFQKIESHLDRDQAVGLMAMEMANNRDLMDQETKMNFIDAIGRFVANLWVD